VLSVMWAGFGWFGPNAFDRDAGGVRCVRGTVVSARWISRRRSSVVDYGMADRRGVHVQVSAFRVE
jgi:hypothetical protein